MAFLPAFSTHGADRTGLRVRLHMQVTGRRGDRRRLTFVLSRGLVEKLGWQLGERIVVALGTEADLGAFQMTRSGHRRVGVALHANSNSSGARLTLSLPPTIHGLEPAVFLDRLVLPQHLDIALEGEALVLRTTPASAAVLPTALRIVPE